MSNGLWGEGRGEERGAVPRCSQSRRQKRHLHIFDIEPVFSGDSGIRDNLVVIRGDIVVSPAGSVRSAVDTSFGQRVARLLGGRLAWSTQDSPRKSCECPQREDHDEGNNQTNEGIGKLMEGSPAKERVAAGSWKERTVSVE